MNKWTSLHVFYHNISKYDDLIILFTDLLAKQKDKYQIDKWFFIRYWEGGPHIRIRLLNAKEEAISELKELIYGYMKAYPPEQVVTREQYYKDNKFDGEPLDETKLPWYENGEIVEIAYEPEIKRYGGENVIDLSESIFCYSSYIVRSILKSLNNDFNKKLIFAEAITLLEVRKFREIYDRTNTSDYLDMYSSHWTSFLYNTDNEKMIHKFFNINQKALAQAYKLLTENSEFMNLLEMIGKEFEKIYNTLNNKDYVDYIVSSHIHMTNNRLGVVPIFEYFIADNLKENESEVN